MMHIYKYSWFPKLVDALQLERQCISLHEVRDSDAYATAGLVVDLDRLVSFMPISLLVGVDRISNPLPMTSPKSKPTSPNISLS